MSTAWYDRLPYIEKVAATFRIMGQLIIEEGDENEGAKIAAEMVLEDAIKAINEVMTDRRELYTADEAIDAIREWAAQHGLELEP